MGDTAWHSARAEGPRFEALQDLLVDSQHLCLGNHASIRGGHRTYEPRSQTSA